MSTGHAPAKRVMVVYGTRPEAIKLAPVIRAIAASPRLRPVVTLTGQHQTIVEQVNSMFGIRPDHDLDVIGPRQSLHRLTARVLERLDPVLREERPDAVVVQGDTTSAFAAALAAFYEHVPVVHVEAGLRTGDLHSPFPEEANRRLTGQIATLHLAPTPVSAGNLVRDGIPPWRVLVTGNTVIDALLWTIQQRVPYGDPALEAIDCTDAPVLLVTTHRRESWGQRMRHIASAVAGLARKHPDLIIVLPLHPNPVVREALLPALQGLENVKLVEPMDYGAFARLLQRCTIILTDSGGIQEEAPSLGKPVLVMRDTTERPEAVSAGTARLVGTDPERVHAEVERLLSCPRAYKTMANAVNPYGDGRAAQRTVKAIEHMFGFSARPAPFIEELHAVGRPAGQGGVEQGGRGGTGHGGRGGVVVHPRGGPAAVVEQVQLAGQDFGLGHAGLHGQLGQQRADPVTVGLGGLLGRVAGMGFRAGPGERAAPVVRLGEQLALAFEHGQQALARGVVAFHRLRDALGDAGVACLQVGADQLVLAAEGVVQRGLGHAGPLDDAVDADRVHALVVEQLVGRGQQPLARRRPGRPRFLDSHGDGHLPRQACLS
jgi:UDP-N-acetylglucosamine 2-epimerase (non-hydrolysing)